MSGSETVVRARAAVDAAPGHPGLHYNLGVALQESGDAAGAGAAFLRATQIKPDFAQAWNNLGLALEDLGRHEEAVLAFEKAVAASPDYRLALRNLGRLALQVGDAVAAWRSLGALAALEPDNWRARFGAELALPAVPESGEAIAAARRHFADGLDRLTSLAEQGKAGGEKCLRALEQHSNFFLAYQGEDDRDLQIRYGRLVRRLVADQAPGFRPGSPSSGNHRLRVGFASAWFRDCTVGHYFRSWITDLDPGRFDVRLFLLGGADDGMTERLRAAAHRTVRIDEALPLAEAARQILEASPDVLIYPELGMQGRAHALAALRLAPVQCAAWGHPVTTGLPTIDYFLSCDAMEPHDAEAHYTETLVRLPGLGTRYSPPTVDETRTRADFGLLETSHLYLVPHPPYKIHPEEDERLAAILAGDPDGVLVFCTGVKPAMSRRFFRRLARCGVAAERLRLLPHLPRPAYLALNRLCDVLLDTSRWSGGNTTLDALASGLPVVTRPGRFMRGRQSAGMLALMGMADLIAASDEDYVALALRLGREPAWREEVRGRIAAARGRLFDDPEPIAALSGFLASLAD